MRNYGLRYHLDQVTQLLGAHTFPWVFYRFCYCILGDDLNETHVVSENHEMPVILGTILRAYMLTC